MKVKQYVHIASLIVYVMFDTCQCIFFNTKKNHEGRITPMEPKVCDGQSITFQCKLLDKPTPNSKLHFAVQIPPEDYVIVNDNDVIRDKNTSANFILRALPVRFMRVKCYYGQRSDVNEVKNVIQDPVLFPVFTMPRQVQDFRCIVNNYNEMRCSWNFGIKYNIKITPNLTLEWRKSGSSQTSVWLECPEQSLDNTWCRWDSVRDGIDWLNKLDIRVTLQQEYCEVNVTSDFTINSLLLVKPSPIIGLNSQVINSTCIQLYWNKPTPPPVSSIEHIYKIDIKSIWNTKEVIINNTQLCDIGSNNEMFTLCHLEEDTDYDFIVTYKSRFGSFWSQDVVIGNTTRKDVPGSSPTIINGGYYWEPEECENSGKMRTMCLLWQGIKDIDKNGDMRGLDLKFKPTGNDVPEEHQIFSEDTTYACARLFCNTTYKAEVTARNEIGMAIMKSSIYINKWFPDIPHPSITVEMSSASNNGLSTVFISYASTIPITITADIYVVWCVKAMGQCQSDGEVNWLRKPYNGTVVTIETVSPEHYLYSVVISNNNGVNYGSSWEDCIHTKGLAPTRSPHNVKVTPGSHDDTLVVKWEELTCKSGEPRIIKYRVKYCNTISKKCSVEDVTFGTTRLELHDLVDDEEYSIQVKALADQSLEGPYSQTVLGTPEHNSLKLPEVIGVACGGFAFLILAIMGCVTTIRIIRKKAYRWKHKMGDIKLPDNLQHGDLTVDVSKTSHKQMTRQLSTDSGVPSTPSPTVVNELNMSWSEKH
ncbi:Protein sidekick-1 [Mactra antiquata]